MSFVPKKAFVLAAGEGRRMRPLTNECPKPLLYVGGQTMLDRTLDALVDVGAEEVMINTCYLGQMIHDHLKDRHDLKITFSDEETLLDTGGGALKALPFFGDDPFFVLNADVVWEDGPGPGALHRLMQHWDATRMDLLLLLHPAQDVPAYAGVGDYFMAEDSDQPVFSKRPGAPEANYIFAGPRLVHPRLFADAPSGAFSFLDLFHKAEAAGRLCGLRHNGAWHHVGTPEAFEKTNALLEAQAPEKKIAT